MSLIGMLSSDCLFSGKLSALYWLPKVHKRTYKSRFIAKFSSCTTIQLSIILTFCLTANKNDVIKW